jgi:hypothetical protein
MRLRGSPISYSCLRQEENREPSHGGHGGHGGVERTEPPSISSTESRSTCWLIEFETGMIDANRGLIAGSGKSSPRDQILETHRLVQNQTSGASAPGGFARQRLIRRFGRLDLRDLSVLLFRFPFPWIDRDISTEDLKTLDRIPRRRGTGRPPDHWRPFCKDFLGCFCFPGDFDA